MVKLKFKIALLSLLAVIICGTSGIMYLEELTFEDALYFTIVTIATVGYGDFTPPSQFGKYFAIFLIITGVGTFLGVIANATEIMLNRRDRHTRNAKLNVIVGLFFTELGYELLRHFVSADKSPLAHNSDFLISASWKQADFDNAEKKAASWSSMITMDGMDFQRLRLLLEHKSDFLARIMENSNLLEHETFTDLLFAVSHLREELHSRKKVDSLPPSDIEHLNSDIKRVYELIVPRWISYMGHLKTNYPYLYSLAVRMNPFNRKASPIVS